VFLFGEGGWGDRGDSVDVFFFVFLVQVVGDLDWGWGTWSV
jgi:hypothetical protein